MDGDHTNSNAALLKEIHDQMKEYAQNNFGAPNGPDFPDLARTLIDQNEFTFDALLLFSMQMATSDSLLPKLMLAQKEGASPATVRSALRGSITEIILLDIFYWGYSFGKRIVEIEALKKMEAL
jgi:hypothetical protein